MPLLFWALVAALGLVAALALRRHGLPARRILLVGDSLSVGPHSPGGILAQLLAAKGASVRVNARGGRSALSFLHSEDGGLQLQQELSYRPELLLVMLGTNDLANWAAGASLSRLLQACLELVDWAQQHHLAVIWIGPPVFDPSVIRGRALADLEPAFVAQLKKIAPHFIDSVPLTSSLLQKGRTSDLVHFTSSGAKQWAEALFTALTGEAPPAHFGSVQEKVLQWLPYVQASAARWGVSIPLILATIHHESGGDPYALSVTGAMSLMQLEPETAHDYHVADPWDPAQNIDGGTHLLADLLGKGRGVEYALASYYAGEGNVAKHGVEHFKDYYATTLALVPAYEQALNERKAA